MKVFPLLLTSSNEKIYKQKHGSHINTFKKDKIDDSFKIIYFFFFCKFFCIEKFFILENYLDGKLFELKSCKH